MDKQELRAVIYNLTRDAWDRADDKETMDALDFFEKFVEFLYGERESI